MKKHNGENLEDEDFNSVGVRVSNEEDDTFLIFAENFAKAAKNCGKN